MVIFRSSLDWPVRKLHIARKRMFYLLYYTESMDEKKRVCFNLLTIYVINQNWNIKGLKSKPFKHFP